MIYDLRSKRYTYWVICLLVVLVVFAEQVHAQESRSFLFSPPTVNQALNPSEKINGKIKLVNLGNKPLTFSAQIHDFIVGDDQGTPQLLGKNQTSEFSLASWITINPKAVTLNPNEERMIAYTVSIPKNAAPGGHYAALIFTPKENLDLTNSGASVQASSGALFYISVKGDFEEKAMITGFKADGFTEYGPVLVQTTIQNLGNIHVRPQGNLIVSDIFGKTIQTVPLAQANIFPKSSRQYQNQMGQKYMFGKFKITLRAFYGQNNNLPLAGEISVWIIPWRIIIVILLILIAFILSLIYFKLKSHKPPVV